MLFTFSPAEQYFKRSLYRIGGVYWKAKYVEYTDESFREEKQQSEEEKHLGILGENHPVSVCEKDADAGSGRWLYLPAHLEWQEGA